MIKAGFSKKSSHGRKLLQAVFLLAFFALLFVPHFIPDKAVAIPVQSQVNGFYAVYVQKGDTWVKAGKIGFDRFSNEKRLDLSSFLKSAEPARVRIVQSGGGAAHIDSIFINGVAPSGVKGAESPFALDKLSRSDLDIIDGFGKSIELEFPAVDSKAVLSLTARVEPAKISKRPFLFPVGNLYKGIDNSSSFYSYELTVSPGHKAAPFFKEFSVTGSGHPSGWTYGWVRNDGENLYVKIDFTPDNTRDGNKDYSKVFIKTETGIREFKVSENETEWGVPHFTYTDKVVYQHKLYDFTIPLSELGIAKSAENLELAFAAYGTASPPGPFYVDGDGSNGNDGSTWLLAKATIDAALTAANNAPQNPAVCVATGTYTAPSTALQPSAGVSLIGAAATTASKNTYCPDTSGAGFGSGASVINGGSSSSFSGVVKYSSLGAGQNSILEGFEIDNTNLFSGNGIYVRDSSPTIRNNTITLNPDYGIFVYAATNETASPTITGNTITGNTFDGIYALATSDSSSGIATVSPTITNNTIDGNSGRGIFIKAYASASSTSYGIAVASPTITGNTISNNTNQGIYLFAFAKQRSSSKIAQVTISGTISNNSISTNGDDGIYVYAYASRNTAKATASPTITNNTISTNSGNGIFVRAYASRSTAKATASPAINNNTVTSNGRSGVFISASYWRNSNNLAVASPALSKNTITGNAEDGIHIYAETGVNHTIANPDLGTAANGTGGNTIKDNADTLTDGNPYTNFGFFDLKNSGSSAVSAQNNWWAATPPVTGTTLGDHISSAGTVDASSPLAQSLAFIVIPPSGTAGNSVLIFPGANSFFVEKVGAPVDNNNISVTIGGAPATNVVVASGGFITATAPAGSGSTDVVVTNPAGQTGTLVGGFVIPDTTSNRLASTAITTVSPADGATGIDLSTTFIWKKATTTDGSAISYAATYCTDFALTTGCSSRVASLSLEQMFGGPGGAAGGLAGLILFGFAFTFRRDARVKMLLVLLLLTTTFMMTSCGGAGSQTADDELAIAVSGLSSGTTYFWIVTGTDKNGNSITSPVSSFTTK